MANLIIPEPYQSALEKLVTLGATQIDALISAIESAGTKPKSLADPLVSALKPLSPTDIREILIFINSLYVVRAAQDVPSDRFLQSFRGTVQATREEKGLKNENPLSGERARKLLSIESLTVTAKATALLTDHDHVFCSARIYTDRRDVFHSDPEESPIGTVIYHTLKLTYFNTDGEHQNFYLALDSSDMAELKSILDRAEKKERNIRKQLQTQRLRCLNPEVRGS